MDLEKENMELRMRLLTTENELLKMRLRTTEIQLSFQIYSEKMEERLAKLEKNLELKIHQSLEDVYKSLSRIKKIDKDRAFRKFIDHQLFRCRLDDVFQIDKIYQSKTPAILLSDITRDICEKYEITIPAHFQQPIGLGLNEGRIRHFCNIMKISYSKLKTMTYDALKEAVIPHIIFLDVF